jgi:hypothetical protein
MAQTHRDSHLLEEVHITLAHRQRFLAPLEPDAQMALEAIVDDDD